MDAPLPPSLALPPDLRTAVEAHTGPLPPSTTRLSLLSSHLDTLPPSLTRAIGSPLSPCQRTVPSIKHRRHVWATAPMRPASLSAAEGRRRWPLLWERAGGDPRAAVPGAGETSAAQAEAEEWAREEFMPGHEHFVGRLGELLAEEEEVGEWEEARRNRARERRLDEVGEEFDESSDEEEEGEDGDRGGYRVDREVVSAGTGDEDQEGARARFERALLELFLDGLDTLDYDDVDFTPVDDPIARQDAEDAWFDDEAPSGGGGAQGNGVHAGSKAMENGQGEYDY